MKFNLEVTSKSRSRRRTVKSRKQTHEARVKSRKQSKVRDGRLGVRSKSRQASLRFQIPQTTRGARSNPDPVSRVKSHNGTAVASIFRLCAHTQREPEVKRENRVDKATAHSSREQRELKLTSKSRKRSEGQIP